MTESPLWVTLNLPTALAQTLFGVARVHCWVGMQGARRSVQLGYPQAPQRRRPPGKVPARGVGVQSGDWTPRLHSNAISKKTFNRFLGHAERATPGKRFPSGTPGRKSRWKKGMGLAQSPRFSASTGVEVSSSQGCEKVSGAVVRTAPDFAWRQRTAGTALAPPPHTDIRAGRSAAGHRAIAGSWRTHGG